MLLFAGIAAAARAEDETTLKIATDPSTPGVFVAIDGSPIGSTGSDGTLTVANIWNGTHRIVGRIANPELRVEPLKKSEMDSTLDDFVTLKVVKIPKETAVPAPAKPAPSPSGISPTAEPTVVAQVSLLTNVPGADVVIDGRVVGKTDEYGLFVVPPNVTGIHNIVVRAEGFADKDLGAIEINLYDVKSVKADLEPIPPSALARLSAKLRGLPPLALLLGSALLGASVVIAAVSGVIHLQRKRRKEMTEKGTLFIFGPYQIRAPLGRGGIAIIYRAVDETGQILALKVLDNKFLVDRDLVAKFEREAPALIRIREIDSEAPVPKVFKHGRHGGGVGTPFIAMELIEGVTLDRHLLTYRGLPPRLTIDIGMAICRVLTAAHSAGITHRDLSPENIILCGKDGRHLPSRASDLVLERCVVIDFGVARVEYVETNSLDGSVAGKPPYMSPEQFDSDRVDSRSDIYSLGVLLYACAAGAPPFSDPNPLTVMNMHRAGKIPPLPSSVPDRLQYIIYRLMERRAEDRPQSASVVAGMLRSFDERHGKKVEEVELA